MVSAIQTSFVPLLMKWTGMCISACVTSLWTAVGVVTVSFPGGSVRPQEVTGLLPLLCQLKGAKVKEGGSSVRPGGGTYVH